MGRVKLTIQESNILPVVAGCLKNCKSKEEAITAGDMGKVLGIFGYKVSRPSMRRVIHAIRMRRTVRHLVASKKGYYVEANPVKRAEYVASLDSRIREIQKVRNSLVK